MRHLPARSLLLCLGVVATAFAPPGGSALHWEVIDRHPGSGVVTAAMVYDPIARRVLSIAGDNHWVIAEGSGGCSSSSNEVWQLRLEGEPRWTLLGTEGEPPSPRRSLAAIDDPERNRVIVYGGFADGFLNDLWQLSLQGTPTWSRIEVAGESPPPLAGSAAVYDSKQKRMILVHGNDGTRPTARHGGVWALELSGTPRWRRLFSASTGPAPRSAHSAVYDSRNDRVIVFGGTTPALSDELWELKLRGHGGWRRLQAPEPRPIAREEHCAIYDPVHQAMIVYGGACGDPGSRTPESACSGQQLAGYPDDSCRLADAWLLDLQGAPRWRRLALPHCIDDHGRWGARAVFDPIGQQMIIHGGCSAGMTLELHLAALGPPAAPATVADLGRSAPRQLPLALGVRLPNPTRGALAMELALPARGARLELFDISGRRVAQRDLSDLGPGLVRYRWDATERLPPGIYLMRLSRSKEMVKKKLILLH